MIPKVTRKKNHTTKFIQQISLSIVQFPGIRPAIVGITLLKTSEYTHSVSLFHNHSVFSIGDYTMPMCVRQTERERQRVSVCLQQHHYQFSMPNIQIFNHCTGMQQQSGGSTHFSTSSPTKLSNWTGMLLLAITTLFRSLPVFGVDKTSDPTLMNV